MTCNFRYLTIWSGILVVMLDFSTIAQSFTKITDPSNPIVTDHGPDQYSGASWIDFDNDGNLDLFINNDKLYRNSGNGTFASVVTTLGTGQPISTGNGNSWADFDNDGDLDVFISSANSFLYRNDGAGNFTRITSGDIGDGFANRGWSCAWADINNDGNIDLAITHSAGYVPPLNDPTMNHVFLNNGPPNFTFTRDTTSAIATNGFAPYTIGTWSDYDLDGDMDYFIGTGPANGSVATDNLFRNLLVETGTASFEKITESPIATDLQDGQVWNWIDYDNDDDLDAYLTNFWGGISGGMANRLYRNDNGSFTRILSGSIVQDTDYSLASVWADFDNDGDLDCFVGNDGNPPNGQPDRYYKNNGDGTFNRITSIAITEALPHRGAAAGDYDNDGKIDLLAVGPGTAKALYHNETQNGNNWVTIKCAGTISNRAAIGAKLRAKANISGSAVWQRREISSQNSFNGHNSLWVHFGLGNAIVVDSLIIEWPSGTIDKYNDIAVNSFYTAIEGSSIMNSIDDTPEINPTHFELFQNYPNPFNPATTIKYKISRSSRVDLSIYDLTGQKMQTLVDAYQPAGQYSVTWNAVNNKNYPAASGVYIYRLQAGSFIQIRKMILLR